MDWEDFTQGTTADLPWGICCESSFPCGVWAPSLPIPDGIHTAAEFGSERTHQRGSTYKPQAGSGLVLHLKPLPPAHTLP